MKRRKREWRERESQKIESDSHSHRERVKTKQTLQFIHSFIDNQAAAKKKTSRHKVNIKRNVEQKCQHGRQGEGMESKQRTNKQKKKRENNTKWQTLQQDDVQTENSPMLLHQQWAQAQSQITLQSQMNSSNKNQRNKKDKENEKQMRIFISLGGSYC